MFSGKITSPPQIVRTSPCRWWWRKASRPSNVGWPANRSPTRKGQTRFLKATCLRARQRRSITSVNLRKLIGENWSVNSTRARQLPAEAAGGNDQNPKFKNRNSQKKANHLNCPYHLPSLRKSILNPSLVTWSRAWSTATSSSTTWTRKLPSRSRCSTSCRSVIAFRPRLLNLQIFRPTSKSTSVDVLNLKPGEIFSLFYRSEHIWQLTLKMR